jgi:hypothetical protein
MSKSKFSVGDKVICIATDGYMPSIFTLGSVFTVGEIYNPGHSQECLRFEEVPGLGGPYSRKFALVLEPTKMDAGEYEEIMAAKELMEGSK